MAMSVGPAAGAGEDEVMMEINTTPLIDVMLVLIIMLIITIPVQLHSVNLDMPVGEPPPRRQTPVVVRLDIDFDGTVLWNGESLSDRTALEARLGEIAAQADPPELHIRANRLVEYGAVAGVLATAQRLGVTKLGLVGHEQFVR